MTKALSACVVFASLLGVSGDRFAKYHPVESYEIRPGIIATPFYSSSHQICEIGLERRRYSGNVVNIDASMSKEQVIEIFNELVRQDERGKPIWGLPEGSEYTDIDNDLHITHLSFDNVTLLMYEQVKPGDQERQRPVAALISWKGIECNKDSPF